MDKQTLFNTVAVALMAQGVPSVDAKREGSPCMYRGPNGLKCAAGHVLPDSEYDSKMENMGVFTVNSDFDVFKDVPLGLLSRLQGAHDHAANDAKYGRRDWIDLWKKEMKNVAAGFDLDVSVLNTA